MSDCGDPEQDLAREREQREEALPEVVDEDRFARRGCWSRPPVRRLRRVRSWSAG